MIIKNFIIKIILRLLPIYQYFLVKRLRHKKQINVVFYACSLAMWRYQHLYDEMSKYPRFKTTIAILPAWGYSKEQREKDEETLKEYFSFRGIHYVLVEDEEGNCLNIKKKYKPDLIFYPQPYGDFYRKEHKCNI